MSNIDQLCALLRESNGYVILRNANVKANLARGGDVDLLVENPFFFSQKLLNTLGFPLMTMKRSYVHGFYWRWGYVDLFPTVEWRGASYLPAEEVLKSAFRNREGFLEASLPHQAVICWFSSLMWGGFFKERYRDLIIKAAQEYGDKLNELLEYSVGPSWAKRLVESAQTGRPETSVAWVKRLRWSLWWRSFFRSPYKTLKGWIRFWSAEVLLRLRPPAPWIAVLGSDGSGKSTLLNTLQENLGHGRPIGDVRIKHWSPGYIRSKKASGPVVDPHSKPPRGLISSIAKLAFLTVDWLAGYWLNLVHIRAKGMLLAFDRHYHDILVDPKRYRYGAPLWLSRMVGRFIPKPDLWLILDVPEEEILRRKQEVPLEEIRRQRKAYHRLAYELPNAYILDGSLPPHKVTRQAVDIILDFMHERYLARRHTWFSNVGQQDDLGWLREALDASENLQKQKACYLHLSLPDGRGYLLPCNCRRAAVAGLSLYPAQKPKARLLKSLLSIGLRTGLVSRILPKTEVNLEPLRNFLMELFKRKDLSLSVSLGTPGPYRKPVIQVASEAGKVLGYVKVGWNEQTKNLVINEMQAIKHINELELPMLQVPKILHFSNEKSRSILVTEPVCGIASYQNNRVLNRAVFEVLRTLAVQTTQKAPFLQSRFWNDLNQRIDKIRYFLPEYHRVVIFKAMKVIENRLDNVPLPWTFRLGDVAKHNIAFEKETGSLKVIDLEYAKENWLVGWDIFHFLCTENNTSMIPDLQPVEIFLRNLNVSPELARTLFLAYMTDLFIEWMEGWKDAEIPISIAVKFVFRDFGKRIWLLINSLEE